MTISRRTLAKAGFATAGALSAPTVWGQAINRDRIILGMTQEPVQFNPLLYVNAGTENVPEACLFDALWDIDDKGDFIPNLAAALPSRENGGISADGLTWRIKLKPGVKWSDGAPFTAKDVEFTFRTIMSPGVAVRSRTGFDLIKDFRVIDDLTVEMVLEKPFIPFLWAWQNMHIVPQHLLAGEANINTATWNAAPIGTGPYLLRQRVAGSHMIYERNPTYHRGPAKTRQFIHKFVPDTQVLYGQARTGEVDYMGLVGVPNDRWPDARAMPDRDFLVYATPNVQFVYFNCGKPQFADPKVRKALTMALEMNKSLSDVYLGTWPRSLSYLQPTHWAYNNSLQDYTGNPEGAAKMLDEAGWLVGPNGVRAKDGVEMKFTMSTTAGNAPRQACQALFQSNWKKIGVEMEIRNFPASVVWGEYTTQSKFDTLLVAWDPTVGLDPDYTARAHSQQIPVKHHVGSNYVQYENKDVDKLFELGVTQANREDRIRTYHQVQAILHEEVPFAPQGGSVQGHLKKKQLTGPKPNNYVTDITWNIYDWAWS